MNIPFKVKLLTPTAKAPHRNSEGDLWDLFADSFDKELVDNIKDKTKAIIDENSCELLAGARVLVKTGIALELPIFENYFAVADLRPRSGLSIKHGLTILNSPGTIDNSYRKEIGVIICNTGSKPYTIKKGDKICQMLIRPLYPSSFEIVEDIEETERGNYGSTGK